MATIPLPERNVAIDTLFTVAREDAGLGGNILDFLRTGFPGFDWEGILRTRAATWQPYIASGLTTTDFCNEVVRYANFYATGRT